MAELGQTLEPDLLVPGRPEVVEDGARALRTRGMAAGDATEGLRAIDTGGWTGPAAESFRAKFAVEPNRWLDAADALSSAADLLTDFAATLRWAKGQASDAAARWLAAQTATVQAVEAYRAAARSGPVPPFTDPGTAGREQAQQVLARARDQLSAAGDDIAALLDAAADGAPEQSNWLDTLGDEAQRIGGDVLAGLASFGNAALHHPEAVLALAGGVALTGVSAIGDGAGLALDATGVGAVAGVPLNVVSTAGVVTGTAITTAAIGALGAAAAGEDRVDPSTPSPRPRPTDRYKEHLTDHDLDGARRELADEVVSRKSTGTPYDHITEVREAQNGLVKRIGRLKRLLGDSRTTTGQRPALEQELSDASKLLDYTERWVPRT